MGDDVQEVEKLLCKYRKKPLTNSSRKATTIEWPESVTINVRGVLHRIDEGKR